MGRSKLLELTTLDRMLYEYPRPIGGHNSGTAVMTLHTFESLPEYSHSLPTGPRHGFVYRRPARDERGPNQAYIMIVVDADTVGDDRGGQLHLPHRVEFI